MTDEELADKYAEEYFGKKTELVELWKVKAYKEAFLTGLKAGGPKWYTPDEKLPEECTTVVAYGLDDVEPTTYHFVCSDQWEWLPRRIAVLNNSQIKKWCEIPQFKDKE